MSRNRTSSAFTLTEMLVVVGILVVLAALLLPSLVASRESARRSECANNLRQLGLAFHGFHDEHKRFPPSSDVTRGDDGRIKAVEGWSFAAHLLPYLEERGLYQSIDLGVGPLAEPDGKEGSPHTAARATRLAVLLCPSDRKKPWADPATRADALTSYKVMGATHRASLLAASPEPATPRYNPEGKHPDGAAYPGSRLRLMDFARDGTAHTILAVETVEPQKARWAVGAEAALVGLPPVVEFAKLGGYYAPAGFDGHYGNLAAIDPSCRTYLAWDYAAEPYDGEDGTVAGRFGPSSKHPRVTNHLFVDGAVRPVANDVDPAAYMFAITRNGGDPGEELFRGD